MGGKIRSVRRGDDDMPPALADTEADTAPARPAGSHMPAGTVIAGRLRIIGFLGQGGMGEVYEAQDEILGERVALKTIRGGGDVAIERFRREVQLARRVTHANVCRIFDLGVDGELMYLTMQLLAGETLAARLKRVGRLREAEALPLLIDMASALEAAHRAGIVHRDFKPGNVMLEVRADGRPRAVVTDFGIARAVAGDDAALSGPGEMIGSPAYMAPEQVVGEPITPATDVYALGAVAYEMVTGRLPFVAETPIATAIRRLDSAPTSPREHVPGLDVRWESWILRCLARAPGDRFSGAEVALRALVDRRAPVARPPRWRWVAAGFAACAVAAAIAIAIVASRGQTDADRGARRSVAVLGFDNSSGGADLAWLSTALTVMLPAELSGERVRVIPGEAVADLAADPDALARAHRELGADVVVSGSYSGAAGGTVTVRLVARDAATGSTLVSLTDSGREPELRELVGRLGSRLRAELGSPPGDRAAIRAAQPSSPEAARLYAEGLAHLRRHDPEAARQSLEAALARDPDQPLVRSALAQALHDLGQGERARAEALRAAERADGLPAEDRLLVEARAAEANGRWEAAIAAYRRLAARYPDDVDHGLRLAAAQIGADRAGDALVTLGDLRRLSSAPGDLARIDLAELGAHAALADFARALEVGDRVLASTGGSATTLAEAAGLRAGVLWSMGRIDEALEGNRDARRRMLALGNRLGAAQVLANEGLILSVRKSVRQAMDRFSEAAAIFRELGAKTPLAEMLGNLAFGALLLGEPVEARRVLVEAHLLADELGRPSTSAYVETLEGWLAYEDGDLDGAGRRLERALALARSAGSDPSDTLAVQADLLRARGDLAGAARLIDQALAESEARHSQAGWHRVARARLAIDLGDAAVAEERAREAIADCRRLSLIERVEESRALRARALVRLGRLDEARRELAGLTEPSLELRGPRIQIAIAWLELDRAAKGRMAPDLERLDGLLAEARRAGHLPDQLELRLLLGRDRGALAREAGDRGFALVAGRARSIR